jgi:pectinesterase
MPANKPYLVFRGENAEKTILTYAHNVNEPDPAAARGFNGTGVVIVANDFCAENITFQNTSGDHGQALALRVNGDRAVFYHCRLLGWQDTLLLNGGRQYFRDCYLAGRVDFIYGAATAVFDRCEIHSKNGGHITAASTPQEQPFGFVFLDCRLTGDPAPWVNPADGTLANNTPRPPKADLGRPWRDYANVAYLRCDLGDHIKPAGFGTWVGAEQREKTARYSEYKNTGPGAATAARLPWTHQLTDEQAQAYTVQNVLKGADGWNPWP